MAEKFSNRRILKDENLAVQMAEQGYIKLPFLDNEQLEFFRALYSKHHKEEPEAFYKSYFSDNVEYKLEVEQAIINAFNEKLGHLFENHIPFGGMFVAKPPLEKGHFTAHQDWSFTDEFEFPSYNMWCPLEDVNDENANLNVLKGSHRFLKTIRGFGTPDVYDHLHKILEPNMVSVPMKAGEVIIFYHGLVHGSTKNMSDKSRVSVGLSLIHKDAPWRFHHFDEESEKVLVFESNPEFYLNYTEVNGQVPSNLKALGESDFKFERLSKEELSLLVTKNQGTFIDLEQKETHDSKHQVPEVKTNGVLNRVLSYFR